MQKLSNSSHSNFESVQLRPEASLALYSFAKRMLDLILSFLVLFIFGLPMLGIALAVKLTSPGPVLFRQTRLGKDCKPFTIYKFRTMYTNTSAESHKNYIKQLMQNEQQGVVWLPPSNDKRVTKIGHFLRRTGLDELPQVFNVLKGQMSLVGPRPPLSYEVELYQEWQLKRMLVLPGISGYWQVFGRGTTSFEEMVKLDIEYINRRNLALDIWIILVTVPSRLTKSLWYQR